MEDLEYSEHSYGSHELQCLATWTLPHAPTEHSPPVSKYWVIYIHGGAWRDPTVTHKSLLPTIKSLLSSSSSSAASSSTSSASLIASIAGFASLSYRLSSHPSYPQDPASTPTAQLRNARHPDHLLDVLSGLKLLQEHYGIGSDQYLLVGHSCGATLAFQSVMNLAVGRDAQSQPQSQTGTKIAPPRAIAGVCGIYDVKYIVEYERQWKDVYRQFIVEAFGSDEGVWDSVSPSCNSAGVVAWAEEEGQGRVVLLASSAEDELVEDDQAGRMEGVTGQLRVGKVVSMRNKLTGSHNGVWEGGDELAKVVVAVLEKVVEIDRQ